MHSAHIGHETSALLYLSDHMQFHRADTVNPWISFLVSETKQTMRISISNDNQWSSNIRFDLVLRKHKAKQLFPKESMYKEKTIGPKTDPCGTHVIFDLTFVSLTHTDLKMCSWGQKYLLLECCYKWICIVSTFCHKGNRGPKCEAGKYKQFIEKVNLGSSAVTILRRTGKNSGRVSLSLSLLCVDQQCRQKVQSKQAGSLSLLLIIASACTGSRQDDWTENRFEAPDTTGLD